MMEILSLEVAEAKLISSLSNLVWILPGLVLIENIISIAFLNKTSWTSTGTLSILSIVLVVVVLFKIINVVDRQLSAEREFRAKKAKIR
ncbi:MAG: hypothetical protein ACXACP_01275 [Candidatus Hodarchaeales archaeon]|jgi:hypothetical protein